MVLTTLAHLIDVEFLREAYRQTRKDGAVGVDGQTAAGYAENLEENLQTLLGRFKSGTYRAPPVRRRHIPKPGGKTRPIGIPTFEDKVLQRAVAMVLGAVYEQDFLNCSYGFRPGRSAHQALEELWQSCYRTRGGWVLEVDIQGFFDALDHSHLRTFLDQRVRDGVLRRTINKWLKAGVLEAGCVSRPKAGTPQGGVVSPILANVYLHEVLDKWFEFQIKPLLEGSGDLIRYADDFVIVFTSESDARRVWDVLPKRFGKYGLTLHPDKTRIIPFQQPRRLRGGQAGGKGMKPGTFDLLGFTHYWAKSKRGNWVVTRKTARSRFSRGVKAIREWCCQNLHLSIKEQHRILTLKVRGHYQYYGISGNWQSIKHFKHRVEQVWRKALNRRSDHARMTWERFSLLLQRHPLPPPRIAHSYVG